MAEFTRGGCLEELKVLGDRAGAVGADALERAVPFLELRPLRQAYLENRLNPSPGNVLVMNISRSGWA